MDILQKLLLELIKEYVSCARYMCGLLKDDYPTKEGFLRARRLNIIPKSGKLRDGIYFNFHGGGCYFEFDGGTIDIDFGPSNSCDGFDQYRLSNFIATSQVHKFREFTSKEALTSQFNLLIKEGYISSTDIYPNPHLFYLTAKGWLYINSPDK